MRKSYDISLLKESFSKGNWDGSDTAKLLIIPEPEPCGNEGVVELESWLASFGFEATTTESTTPPYHQVLVGVEGWEIDLAHRTWERLDDFNVKWKRFQRGESIPVASISQLEQLMTDRPGQMAGAMYGV